MWTRSRRALALTLLSALAVIGGGSAATASSLGSGVNNLFHVLPGTVSQLLGDFQRLGPLALAQKVTVTLPLALPDQSALNDYVNAEYTPGSASYRKFLTPAQFGQRFGASSSEIAQATQALQSLGLTVRTPTANHLYLSATASVSTLEHVFGTQLERFQIGGHARLSGENFFANTSDIHLPASLNGLVTDVIGLDDMNAPQAQTAPQRTDAAKPFIGSSKGVDGGATPCLGANAGIGYTAPDLATAYDFNGLYAKGLHGEGMSAALVEYDDYHDSNVQTMESCYGITTPVTRRLVDGGVGGPPSSGETEDMLDITILLEMLPKLQHLYVYEAPNTGPGAINRNGGAELDLYNAFVADDSATVLSSSWGNCEQVQSQGYDDLMGAIAEEAAAQGQQIFDAAGDSGAVGCGSYPNPIGNSISVEQEAAIPWITGVGGTDLSEASTIAGTTTHRELPWNDSGSGGGGQSAVWTMPAWQQSYLAATHTSPAGEANDCGAPSGTLCRMVPDVSMDADPALGGSGDALYGGNGPTPSQFSPTDIGSPGYSIYCATPNCTLLPISLPITLGGGLGGWEPVGGTSAATPLLASAAVLWDQEAKAAGLGSSLGFLNPAFYRLASDPATYAADFHDVTTGTNSDQYSAGCGAGCNPHQLYSAGTGYDMATGLGSINATALGASLVGQAQAIDATPSREQLFGYAKGPKQVRAVSITGGAGGAEFTAKSSAKWLIVTPAGTVPGSLTYRVNPAKLKPGHYTGHITVHGQDKSRTTLTVNYSVTPKAKLTVTPKALTFSEPAITAKGATTTPTCNASVWSDEQKGALNGSSDTSPVAPTSLATVQIKNTGRKGSVLHWEALFVTSTSSWLTTDLNPANNPNGIQIAPSPPLVPTEGAIKAGKSYGLKLASVANSNAVGGYPPMNQGTYQGFVQIRDLANHAVLDTIPAKLILGNGEGTPTVAPSPAAIDVSLAPGASTTAMLNLTDSSNTCGYVYSLGTGAAWAQIDPFLGSGTVTVPPATVAPSADDVFDTGSGNGVTPITISAVGLTPGLYRTTVTINSQNAQTNPTVVPISLTVTGATKAATAQ